MILSKSMLARGIHVEYNSDVPSTKQYLIGALRQIARLSGMENGGKWWPSNPSLMPNRYVILLSHGGLCLSDTVLGKRGIPTTQRVSFTDVEDTLKYLEYEALPYKFHLMAGSIVLAGGYASLEEAEIAGEKHTRKTKESVTVVEMRRYDTFTHKVTETVEVVRS